MMSLLNRMNLNTLPLIYNRLEIKLHYGKEESCSVEQFINSNLIIVYVFVLLKYNTTFIVFFKKNMM